MGASAARTVLVSALKGAELQIEDVASIVGEASQVSRFNRDLLESTLENVAEGISVIDANCRLVAWNRRYAELFQYPEHLLRIGTPLADLIRYNAGLGRCGPGDVEEHVAKRLAHFECGRAARVPARPRRRLGDRDAGQPAAGRRLRRQLQRHHRAQAHRAGAARERAQHPHLHRQRAGADRLRGPRPRVSLRQQGLRAGRSGWTATLSAGGACTKCWAGELPRARGPHGRRAGRLRQSFEWRPPTARGKPRYAEATYIPSSTPPARCRASSPCSMTSPIAAARSRG
jgi:hypothetical protein